MHPRFPLGDDDYYQFGVKPQGREDRMDTHWLCVAQRALRVRWGYKSVQPTGRMDAATSAAVCDIQKLIGHKPNGELDEQTWNAVFTETK